MADASGKWSASLSRPAVRTAHWLRGLALLVILSPLCAAFFGGCVLDETEQHGPPIGSGGAPTSTSNGPGGTGGGGACNDGDTQECSVTLGEHNNVLDCYHGTQTCSGGAWGPCGDGQVSPKIAPPGYGSHGDGPVQIDLSAIAGQAPLVNKPLALSAPVMCINNPCDPRCKAFIDVPPGGYTIPGSPSPPWSAGGLTGIVNSGLILKGTKSPCSNAGDCQFGEYCNNPNTDPSCAHDICARGAPLLNTCDPGCAQKICAVNPTCCVSAGPCAHDVCVTGAKLQGCADPCAIAVCAVKPTCCTGTWDQSCVDQVPLSCPQTCPRWSSACVQAVHDVCGSICLPNGTCAHDKCITGGRLTVGCGDPCVDTICAANPSCCTTGWDSTCVNAVSTCGQACPLKAQCKPWLPGQVDPACTDVDLVGGIPCLGVIPICNVGTATAPAGVPVEFYPANSGHIPQCGPSGGQVACPATPLAIPPGQCIDLTCPGITGNEEIVVNAAGPGHISECQCQNNWTINTNNANCEPANCTGPNASKRVKRPDYLFAIDRSTNIAAGDFTQLQNALTAFFASSYMSSVVAGVELYPDTSPGQCDTAHCANPTNCGSRIPYSTTVSSWTTAVTGAGAPAGNAPHSAALAGGYVNLASYQATQVATITTPVMVYIMAGTPAFCNPSIAALAGQAAAQYVNTGTPTFVIGIGVSQANVDLIANAGGGTGYAITPGPNVQTTVTAALQDIRIHSYPCSFDLPGPGLYDPSSSSATYFPPPSLPGVPIPHVTDLASCPASGHAFYYDNNVVPTKMLLCPASCSTISLAIGGSVQWRLQCPQNYGTQTFTQDYTSDCPANQKVQWGYLAYDTLALAGTSVDFSAQTGPSVAMLGAPVPLVTAKASPNTQKCLISGPAPCPIDLFAKLGGLPQAQNDVLRLQMKLNSNIAHTLTPTVNSWQLTYTCVDLD